jgi:hypothetical protein
MWIRTALVLAAGLALAQSTLPAPGTPTAYDQPVIESADLPTVLATLAAAQDNVFALLPDLDTPVTQALSQLATRKTVYLIIPAASHGHAARDLLAAGVNVRTIPGDLPAGVIVVDYQTVIAGDLGGGEARIIRSGSDELLLVQQLRAAWQAATPYQDAP